MRLRPYEIWYTVTPRALTDGWRAGVCEWKWGVGILATITARHPTKVPPENLLKKVPSSSSCFPPLTLVDLVFARERDTGPSHCQLTLLNT